MKKWLFPLLFAGVCGGTLFVNFFGIDVVKASMVFNNDYFNHINSVNPEMKALMQYIAGARLKEFALIMLLMLTPFSGVLINIIVFVWGFVNGMLSSICVIQQGMYGFLIFLAMSVPSFLIFYPGMYFLSVKIFSSRRKNLASCILAGIFITACCSFAESYFFINLIKKLISNL